MFGFASKRQKAARQFGCSFRGFADNTYFLQQLMIVRPVFFYGPDLEKHRREQIIKFMRDAADELSDRAQFSRLRNLLIELFSLGHILHKDAGASAIVYAVGHGHER